MLGLIKKILIKFKNLFRALFAYLKYNFRVPFKNFLVGTLFLILSLGVIFGLRSYFKNTPTRTVRNYIAALENKKFSKALEYIYPEDREKLSPTMKVLELSEIKFSHLKIRTLEENSQKAKVEISGKVILKLLHTQKEENIEKVLELTRKDNRWYLRGLLIQK